MADPEFNPFPFLKTERCQLVRINQEHLHDVLMLRSNDAISKFMDREKMANEEEAQNFINNINESVTKNQAITWGICFKNEKQLIGTIGFWKIMKEHYRAEIGYLLHPDHWNKGIMTEVLAEVIRFGFTVLNLHSIEANINPANISSIKLLEKQGFVKEAYFKENFYFNGKFLDSVIYSLINNSI